MFDYLCAFFARGGESVPCRAQPAQRQPNIHWFVFNLIYMRLLLRWLISAVTLMLIAYYLPGVAVASFYAALIAALILGLLNALVRPLLLLLTLPVNIITLGLFTFVINALVFWLASSIAKGFYVDGFWPAFWGALIMWLVGVITNSLLKKN